MAESFKRVISGKKLGSVFMPSSPMTTHYKRAAAAPAVSEAEIEFPGEQLNQGNIDAPHASSFVIHLLNLSQTDANNKNKQINKQTVSKLKSAIKSEFIGCCHKVVTHA